MWGYSLGELFERGGLVMWPLLLFSLFALAIVLERTVTFLWTSTPFDSLKSRLQQTLGGQDQVAASRKLLLANRSPLARVADVYLQQIERGVTLEALHERTADEASRQLASLEKRLHWLSVIGTLAPMLGLLGTVMGLVEAFHQIEALGGQLQPGDLAAGIWKALLTTVFGLIVGLPALGAYHLLDHRVSTIGLQMQWITSFLNQQFDKYAKVESEPATPSESLSR